MQKKISLIQMAPILAKPQENFRKAALLLENALQHNPDILVLPETFNVGFFPRENLRQLADEEGDQTKELLSRFAKTHGVNIVGGSAAVVKQGRVYNTSYIFNRAGQCVGEYDKIHGFTPLAEHEYFQAGNKTVIFELDGIPCSVVICYDLRFTELVRTVALQGAELLFVPAQWPLVRKKHWEILNHARAIENQMVVCAVNGCGQAGQTQFGGHSMLIDPLGEQIIGLGEQEEIATAAADFTTIREVRNSINVFRDRRPDTYQIN